MTIELGDCLEAEFEIKLCETCNLCAEQLAVATKNPEQGTRSGFTVGPKLPGGVGVSGDWECRLDHTHLSTRRTPNICA